METRRRTRRVQVASSDQASSLGVHAPSVVQTRSKAADQAFALSNALGFAQKFAGEQIQAKQARDDEAGALAAMKGEFTDEELHTMQKSAAYVRGAQRVLAKQRIVEDAAAAQEWYQTEFDKGAGLDDLRAGLNKFWADRYEGISTGLAREVAPLMAQTSDKLMTAHAGFQAEQTQIDVETAIVSSASAAFETGAMNAEEWKVARSDAIELAGKDRANELLFAAVEQHVAATGNPDVWDEPYLEMLKTNPKFAQRAAKSRGDAAKAQRKAYEDATVLERAAIEATLIESAQAGSPTTMTDLRNQFEAGNVDEEIVRNVTKQYANAVVEFQVADDFVERYTRGATAALDLSDADYSDRSKAAFGFLVEQNGEAEGTAMFLDGIVKNGRMPTWVKRRLDAASVSNPDEFAASYAWYSTMMSADPLKTRQLVTERTQTLFDSYELMRADYGDAAMDHMQNVDPSLVANVPKTDYNDYLDDAIGEVEDGPWFNNLDEADPYTRKIVKQRYNHMLSLGRLPEKAAEFAVADIKKRYTIRDGKLWPNAARPPAQPVLDYVKKSYQQTDEDNREYEIVPAMNRPGFAWVRPQGALAYGGELVRVDDMTEGYRMDQSASREAAFAQKAAETKSEHLNEAMQRATGLYSLPHDKSVMGDNMRQAQQDAWNALPADIRMEAIREVEREAQADIDDLARRRRNAGEFSSIL